MGVLKKSHIEAHGNIVYLEMLSYLSSCLFVLVLLFFFLSSF